jgi:hippurate hydrolase
MVNKITMLFVAAMMTLTKVNSQLPQQVRQMAYADSARLVTIFKDIHQNPELGFMEVHTSGIIAKELKSLGFRVITGDCQNRRRGNFKEWRWPGCDVSR